MKMVIMKRALIFAGFFFCSLQVISQGSRAGIANMEIKEIPGHFSERQSAAAAYVPPAREVVREKDPKTKNNFFKKLFIKFYGGYGLFTPGSYSVFSSINFEWTDKNNYATRDTTKRFHSRKGIGYGPRLGLGIGLVKNDFLNFGIDVEYQKAKGIRSSLTVEADEANYYTSNDEMNYTIVTLTPWVVFKALAKPKFYLYNKLGVSFTRPFTLHTSGTRTGTEREQHPDYSTYINGIFYRDIFFTNSRTGTYTYETEDKIRLAVGVNVAFGLNFRINTHWRVFGEIFGNYSALMFKNSSTHFSSKYISLFQADSANFHVENTEKHFDLSNKNTDYKRSGYVGSVSYNYVDSGMNSEGYYETEESTVYVSHRNSINMAVVGINIGLLYRF